MGRRAPAKNDLLPQNPNGLPDFRAMVENATILPRSALSTPRTSG
jgi:hypothetical protein